MRGLMHEAYIFAQMAHEGQTRKYTGERYFVHCDAVATAVARQTNDYRVIAAAYLHDVLEDTNADEKVMRKKFGDFVIDMVVEMTDVFTTKEFPYLNRKIRKELECLRMKGMSPNAKLIKRCDIADNTTSIVAHDPDFAKTYLVEKAAVLEAIG